MDDDTGCFVSLKNKEPTFRCKVYQYTTFTGLIRSLNAIHSEYPEFWNHISFDHEYVDTNDVGSGLKKKKRFVYSDPRKKFAKPNAKIERVPVRLGQIRPHPFFENEDNNGLLKVLNDLSQACIDVEGSREIKQWLSRYTDMTTKKRAEVCTYFGVYLRKQCKKAVMLYTQDRKEFTQHFWLHFNPIWSWKWLDSSHNASSSSSSNNGKEIVSNAVRTWEYTDVDQMFRGIQVLLKDNPNALHILKFDNSKCARDGPKRIQNSRIMYAAFEKPKCYNIINTINNEDSDTFDTNKPFFESWSMCSLFKVLNDVLFAHINVTNSNKARQWLRRYVGSSKQDNKFLVYGFRNLLVSYAEEAIEFYQDNVGTFGQDHKFITKYSVHFDTHNPFEFASDEDSGSDVNVSINSDSDNDVDTTDPVTEAILPSSSSSSLLPPPTIYPNHPGFKLRPSPRYTELFNNFQDPKKNFLFANIYPSEALYCWLGCTKNKDAPKVNQKCYNTMCALVNTDRKFNQYFEPYDGKYKTANAFATYHHRLSIGDTMIRIYLPEKKSELCIEFYQEFAKFVNEYRTSITKTKYCWEITVPGFFTPFSTSKMSKNTYLISQIRNRLISFN